MSSPRLSIGLSLAALAAGAGLPCFAQEPDADIAAGADAGDDVARMPVAAALPADTPNDVVTATEAQTPVTGLADALRRAYWTSPSLLSQRSLARGMGYRVAEARAAYGPALNYSLTYGFQKDIYEYPLRPGHYFVRGQGWSSTASAVLNQPLFTFGRVFSQERFALAQAAFQQAALRSTEQQALLDAITAYVGLQRDRASVQIARDNLDTLEHEFSDNRARFAVREVTSTELQQVETRVELGRVQLLAAQRDAASSEAAFVRMIGARPGDLAPPNPLQLPVQSLEEAYAFAELHNPVILAAQQRERASRASVQAARADLLPRVDLRGNADYFSQSPYQDGVRAIEFRGAVVISGPIYESGLRRAKINDAEAANDSDWRLIDASLRENRATLASAWNDWQAQTAAIDRLANAVTSAQKAYDGAVMQERAGMVTTLDVLQLARELLTARSNANSAMAAAYLAKAQVLAALGSLEQSWLLPDAARHDAQGRYDRAAGKGDTPFVTGVVRAVDGTTMGSFHTRPSRDPAARIVTPAVTLSLPGPPAP